MFQGFLKSILSLVLFFACRESEDHKIARLKASSPPIHQKEKIRYESLTAESPKFELMKAAAEAGEREMIEIWFRPLPQKDEGLGIRGLKWLTKTVEPNPAFKNLDRLENLKSHAFVGESRYLNIESYFDSIGEMLAAALPERVVQFKNIVLSRDVVSGTDIVDSLRSSDPLTEMGKHVAWSVGYNLLAKLGVSKSMLEKAWWGWSMADTVLKTYNEAVGTSFSMAIVGTWLYRAAKTLAEQKYRMHHLHEEVLSAYQEYLIETGRRNSNLENLILSLDKIDRFRSKPRSTYARDHVQDAEVYFHKVAKDIQEDTEFNDYLKRELGWASMLVLFPKS